MTEPGTTFVNMVNVYESAIINPWNYTFNFRAFNSGTDVINNLDDNDIDYMSDPTAEYDGPGYVKYSDASPPLSDEPSLITGDWYSRSTGHFYLDELTNITIVTYSDDDIRCWFDAEQVRTLLSEIPLMSGSCFGYGS